MTCGTLWLMGCEPVTRERMLSLTLLPTTCFLKVTGEFDIHVTNKEGCLCLECLPIVTLGWRCHIHCECIRLVYMWSTWKIKSVCCRPWPWAFRAKAVWFLQQAFITYYKSVITSRSGNEVVMKCVWCHPWPGTCSSKVIVWQKHYFMTGNDICRVNILLENNSWTLYHVAFSVEQVFESP